MIFIRAPIGIPISAAQYAHTKTTVQQKFAISIIRMVARVSLINIPWSSSEFLQGWMIVLGHLPRWRSSRACKVSRSIACFRKMPMYA